LPGSWRTLCERAVRVEKKVENTLSGWLEHIEALHSKPIDMGLERMVEMIRRMGISFAGKTVITVGGTNGKGSTCAMLERIYRAAGYTTGMHTSPHLLRINERCVVNGEEVSDETLMAAFREVETTRGEMTLSYFEYTALAFLKIFQAAGLDVVILEIGLGGRLDAINTIDSNAAVIATVGLDHCAYLGNTREAIGAEKACIYRSGCPAVFSGEDVPQSVRAYVEKTGAKRLFAGEDFEKTVLADGTWNLTVGDTVYKGLPRPGLEGLNQYANAAGVLATVTALMARLPVSRAAIETGLTDVRLAGRFETVLRTPVPVVIDVGHNPQAAEVLARNIAATKRPGERTFAVFGMLADKDMQGVASILRSSFDEWYIASLTGPRAATAEQLREAMLAAGIDPRHIRSWPDVRSALCAAREDALMLVTSPVEMQSDEPVRIIVFGSFVTVTAAAEIFRAEGIAI